MPRRLAPLAPLALAACFVDVGPGATAPVAADAATDDLATTGVAEPVTTATGAPDPSSSSVTAADTTTTTDTSDATGSVDPSVASMPTAPPMTTDTPAPTCGDGIVDSREQCDDGNLADDDFCLSNCLSASCSDGIVNQGEPDVDCGGPCPPCGPCAACTDDNGCGESHACVDGRCSEHHVAEFDYAFHCGIDPAVFLGVPLQSAGLWRVEALAGGGRVLDDIAYGWTAACTGLDLSGLGTPFIWSSPEEAFAAIDPTSVLVDHLGGAVACGLFDDLCFDNAGSSRLGFTRLCP